MAAIEQQVVGPDELDRHAPAHAVLPREVDDAHAAAADALEQPEVTDAVGDARPLGQHPDRAQVLDLLQERPLVARVGATQRGEAGFVAPLQQLEGLEDEPLERIGLGARRHALDRASVPPEVQLLLPP